MAILLSQQKTLNRIGFAWKWFLRYKKVMKVIFLKDVGGVARRGEVKEVADGYALNALIPRGLVQQATASAIVAYEKLKAQDKEAEAKRIAQMRAKLDSLEGKKITIKVRANEKGHLFKSINAKEILAAVHKETGVEFSEQSLKANTLPLRGVGEHPIYIETAGAKAGLIFAIEAA